MKPHRLAEYFPLLEGEEFEQLKQDIKDNGQIEPIITFNGEILDGVNRYNACQELGIEPITEEYKGSKPISYVISANIRRRHLNESQRGIIATEMLPELEEEARKRKGRSDSQESDLARHYDGYARSVSQAARKFNVSAPTVIRAKRVKEQAPNRIPDIMAGKTTVGAVDTELREKRAAEKMAAKQTKAEDRQRQDNPHEVKEYYDALKMFKAHLKVHKQQVEKAIRVAEYGKFAPEARNFTEGKHTEVIDLMNEIQNLYDQLERSI